MGIRQIVQKTLDDALLQRGILSHYMRRIDATNARNAKGEFIKVNTNIYLVYRILASRNGHGDGKPITVKPYVDINLYFTFEKTNTRYEEIDNIINDIKVAFLNHGQFVLANDANDLYDVEAPYRGVNIEFRYIGSFATTKAAEVENAP